MVCWYNDHVEGHVYHQWLTQELSLQSVYVFIKWQQASHLLFMQCAPTFMVARWMMDEDSEISYDDMLNNAEVGDATTIQTQRLNLVWTERWPTRPGGRTSA